MLGRMYVIVVRKKQDRASFGCTAKSGILFCSSMTSLVYSPQEGEMEDGNTCYGMLRVGVCGMLGTTSISFVRTNSLMAHRF